jgi:hypothetical protein
MSAVKKHKMHPTDWTFMFVAVVMSLALTRVGGKLFAADSAPPRKIAIVASGYHDEDGGNLRNSLVTESERLVQQLNEFGYETTWISRDSRKGTKGVAFRFFAAVDSLSLKKDDRLIIVLNGHGTMRMAGKTAHLVAFGDGSKLDVSGIAGKLEAFTLAGAKVAVIDESCYSGNSIDLSSTGACVISAQNRFNYSRTASLVVDSLPLFSDHDFPHEFRNALTESKGSDLEEVFLKARRNLQSIFPHMSDLPSGVSELVNEIHYGNDLPEISSWEHLAFRDYWDQVFFSDDPDFWKSDLSPLQVRAASRLSKVFIDFFQRQAKKAFSFTVLSYDRFAELQEKRTSWLNEVGRLESSGKAQDPAAAKRKQALINLLRSTSEEYFKLLGGVYKVERRLYDEFYRAYRKSRLPTNACREFKL